MKWVSLKPNELARRAYFRRANAEKFHFSARHSVRGFTKWVIDITAYASPSYGNQHGYHHRHYFGVVEPVSFTSFEDIEDQFQADWSALRSKA